MKGIGKGTLPSGHECFIFGEENKLKIFSPNSFNFKAKSHIRLDEIQRCILDNMWFQYAVKREERGYMLSNLNSLAEYFHTFNTLNKNSPRPSKIEKEEPLYILFNGNRRGIYMHWEDIQIEKLAAKQDLSYRKYDKMDEALKWALKAMGPDYYICPEAREYIEKRGGIIPASAVPSKGEASSSKSPMKEAPPKYQSYQECLLKGIDPLDKEYIDQEIEKRLEELAKTMKKELKEEISNEMRIEMDIRVEEIKKVYDSKYDFHLNDEDLMDIAGHGQQQEY
jgi:hypothetical protein